MKKIGCPHIQGYIKCEHIEEVQREVRAGHNAWLTFCTKKCEEIK